jgi:hypothetical protein
VKLGYFILNDKGQVIQEIKRAPTPEELAKIEASKQADQKAITDKVAQEENDKVLIRLYRAPEEVVKKRDAAIAQQKTQRDLVRLNLNKALEEVKRFQEAVDTAAKAGKEPPPEAKKRLTAALASKEKNEAQLQKMEDARLKLISDAERDFNRLHVLMSLPAETIAPPPPPPDSAEKPAAQ